MTSTISLSQASLAAAIATSTLATFIALSPPHKNPTRAPPTGDFLRHVNVTGGAFRTLVFVLIGLLSFQTCVSILSYPRLPSSLPLLFRTSDYTINPALLTPSPSTLLPLAVILLIGAPLRLIAYASLGKNFTFALSKPDGLTTSGVYGWVQHPSYTGMAALVMGNVALLARTDGVLASLVPRAWAGVFEGVVKGLAPLAMGIFGWGLWTRVRQEEEMLRGEFGREWEQWHKRTARFIPWIF
ncbi:isoprenylcysteine carboxyl methyltransferase protein [Rutstroemia sp. NJR-2017a BVV2]|nr:isoprenylcysteine carboxyl methyltransferase protein [Rutstroemia sp. NJR-2017a BVV2]